MKGSGRHTVLNQSPPRIWVWLFFSVLAILLLVHNEQISLWDQDEAAYAGFARTMLQTGNWVIPDFMWGFIHRKPPLHFWNIALAAKVFGMNEFSVRFSSSLAVWLTLFLMYRWGRHLWGARTSLMASFILSTSLLVPALGKIALTDGTLLLFSTMCGLSIAMLIRKPSYKWVFVFWMAFALAVLTKGPPVILFTGFLCAGLLWRHPDRQWLYKLKPWFFLPLALLPLACWVYATIQMDGGTFARWMADWYILKRVGGGVLGQEGPPGTHLLFMLIFFLPWLRNLPVAVYLSVRSFLERTNHMVFTLWFLAGWLPWELSPSKLPSYAVVAHVPLAFFLADAILHHGGVLKNWRKTFSVIQFSLTHALFVVICLLPLLLPVATTSAYVFYVSGGMLIVFNVFAASALRTPKFIPRWVAVNALFQVVIWVLLMPIADQWKSSTRRTAILLENLTQPGTTVVIGNNRGRPPSLPYYLGDRYSEILVEKRIDSLNVWYGKEEPVALILNESQAIKLAELRGELPQVEVHPGLYTDRLDKAGYILLINPEAQLVGR
ncbi:MAG: glycosyltransferase family 39 protein [Flavobacteriales bacterium]|nr:glycosyltransferase family 39 protein [Flavobacteriales bacterium]